MRLVAKLHHSAASGPAFGGVMSVRRRERVQRAWVLQDVIVVTDACPGKPELLLPSCGSEGG